jgi:hypothetical protein
VIGVLSLSLVQFASAQTANQNLNISVAKVTLMSISGDPGALAITTGTVGVDDLTPATNSATTYSLTQNAGTAKITAELDAALAKGVLKVKLGTGADVDISATTTGSGVDVLTGIAPGAQTSTIAYTFSAKASDGLISATKVVKFTLVTP